MVHRHPDHTDVIDIHQNVSKRDGRNGFSPVGCLVRTKEYGNPNIFGYFEEIKDWREEVVIQPDIPDEMKTWTSVKSLLKTCQV